MKYDDSKLWEAYFEDRSVENRNAIMEFHMGLIGTFAFKMENRYSRSGYTADDFKSWGTFGMIHAIENYNPVDNDNRFTTYACKCIYMKMREGIMMALRNSRTNTYKGHMTASLKQFPNFDKLASKTDDQKAINDRDEIEWLTANLSEIEWYIVRRYYLEGIPQGRVGKEIGKSRASTNAHAMRALAKMRIRAGAN